MSRVLTNNVTLQFARQSSVTAIPTSGWKQSEPNAIREWGSETSKVARNPISKKRQRRKGTVVDVNSKVGYDSDFTMTALRDHIEEFMFSTLKGTAQFTPTAVTGTGYTVPSGGALTQGWLVYARNFAIAANNGLKVLGASSTGTEIKTSGLSAEASAPATARLDVAGVQGATGDIEINASGNLISTVLDFTTLPLFVGQSIRLGGSTSGLKFATAANNDFGRIVSIAAHVIVLDRCNFVTDNGSGKTIQILFGNFIKNVSSDSGDYQEIPLCFEAAFPDLGGVGTDEYEYAMGNYANMMDVNLPLTDKATIGFGFVGTDTDVPTTTRATGADSAIAPTQTEAMNSVSNVAQLAITDVDEVGLTTDFKSLKISIKNAVSPEKIIGTLGAAHMNFGNFQIDIEAQLLFTDSSVVAAIRNNTTCNLRFGARNDDGGALFDIPSMTLGGGAKELPVDASVLLTTTAEAFEDPVLATSLSVSLFPYLPAS